LRGFQFRDKKMGWCRRTTQFCGDLLDTVPAVRYIKDVFHYAISDTEGGNKAMLSATRSTAKMQLKWDSSPDRPEL